MATITKGFLSDTINGLKINSSYPCNSGNYSNTSSRDVKYIVIHYTGNQKDIAINNCKYFQTGGRKASAHFFVDDTNIYQSVELRDTAWHCGTSGKYYHSTCRNANAFGIEMCCTSGNYTVSEKTQINTAYLCAHLCKLLGVTASNVDTYVLRHYDVTHKGCPRQYVSNTSEWTQFKTWVKNILNTGSHTTTSATVSLKTGTTVTLSKTPVYSSATAKITLSKKTGTFYIWSSEVINGRVRITNAQNRVGVNGQVTGWVNTSDIGVVSSSTTTSSSSTTTTTPTTTTSTTTTKKYLYGGIDYALVFDPIYYANKYPDVKAAFGTNATALWNHFKSHGMKEHRQGSANFNVEVYRNNYSDLRQAFGNDWTQYYKHYVQYGFKENRKAV